MSARTELEAIIKTHRTRAGAPQSMPRDWVMQQVDAPTARRAAVLMLFGHHDSGPLRDDSPADELDLLFVTRAATLRNHAGQIAFPGGGKGMVWLNGFLLGRYWSVGPQETLYAPAPLWRAGRNEIVVLDTDGLGATVEIREAPSFGETEEFIGS